MCVKNCGLYGILWTLIVCITAEAQQQYLEVTSSVEPGGKTPQQLVEMIVDPLSSIQPVPGTVAWNIKSAGNTPSSLRAMGDFSNGVIPPNTPLPLDYQPDPENPTGVLYTGGIGIESGICLCTGLVTDNDPDIPPGTVPEKLGVGMQGPNNGHPLNTQGTTGEVDFNLGTPSDTDFVNVVGDGWNATVLTFDLELESPGILQITYVHGTDEHPIYSLSTYNDTFLVLIRDPDCPPEPGQQEPPWKNIIVFRGLNEQTGQLEENTLSLADLEGCGMLLNNLVAPVPPQLLKSLHADFNHNGVVDADDLASPRYDHEFAGFSVPLTFESISPLPTSPLYRYALAPGVYNIKMVIQDVGPNNDPYIDSAAFIKEHSLKLFPLQQGDYNGDGIVDYADYYVWAAHFGQSPATFYDGDGTGDCVVNSADYVRWRDHQGQTGNADLAADLDRSGCVSQGDLDAVLLHWGLAKCASRFEGDANGDGAVGQPDLDEVLLHWGEGNCGQALMAGGGDWEGVQAQLDAAGIAVDVEQFAAAQEELAASAEASGSPSAADLARIPESPDLNGDGQVDADEIARLTKIVYEAYFGASESPASVSASADEPVSSTDAGVASASTPEPVQVLPEPESMPEEEFVLVDETVPAEEAPPADEPPPVDEAPPTPPPGPFGPPLPVPPGAPR